MVKIPGPYVWIDCEMTGLNPFKDRIIEICCILTDGKLNKLEPEGFEAVIHQPKEVMDAMGEWCTEHHGRSGLTQRVLESTQSLEDVNNSLMAYLKKYIDKPGTAVLAGNSIHQDRMFLLREFPQLIEYLHYRQVDVSSIKEVGERHNPGLIKKKPSKKGSHTARADVEESIEELRWYYNNYLISPAGSQSAPAPTPAKRKK